MNEALDVGRDEYPKTVVGAYNLLLNTQRSMIEANQSNRRFETPRRDGVESTGGRQSHQFLQVESPPTNEHGDRVFRPGVEIVLGRNRKVTVIQCNRCGKWGLYANNCDEDEVGGGAQFLMCRYSFTQAPVKIQPTWHLIDTCSTSSTSNNPELVENIRDCPPGEEMTAHTNGGPSRFVQTATLKLLPLSVYFNENSLATILAFSEVASLPGINITMNSNKERAILVHMMDSKKVLKFKECSSGLYYYNSANPHEHEFVVDKLNYTLPYSFLQTTNSNKEFLTPAEIQGADLARRTQGLIGWPSTESYKNIVKLNLLDNSPITVDDINRAEQIYGPAIPTLKGKMTRPKPKPINKIVRSPLPSILESKALSQYFDILYVNGLPFLASKASDINYFGVTALKSRSAKQIIAAVTQHKKRLEDRSFVVSDAHADNEFDIKALKEEMKPTLLHICAKNEHVGTIERGIRTIKERCRCMVHDVPYRRYTRLMVRSLLESVVDLLNHFPSKNSVSKTMSPATIVEGKPRLDLSQKRLPFGAYAQAWVGTYNNMTSRSIEGIALQASNLHGGFYFMSLETGKEINCYKWEELPITNAVISRVKELAEIEKQPKIHKGQLPFEWAPGQLIHETYREYENFTNEDVQHDAPDDNDYMQDADAVIDNENEDDQLQEDENYNNLITDGESDENESVSDDEST